MAYENQRKGNYANWSTQVIKQFEKKKAWKGEGFTVLEVIQHYRDGKLIGGRQLVKKEYWVNDKGDLVPGKIKGLKADDVDFISKNALEIVRLLDDRPFKSESIENQSQNQENLAVPGFIDDDIPF